MKGNKKQRFARPRVEGLEDRITPAVSIADVKSWFTALASRLTSQLEAVGGFNQALTVLSGTSLDAAWDVDNQLNQVASAANATGGATVNDYLNNLDGSVIFSVSNRAIGTEIVEFDLQITAPQDQFTAEVDIGFSGLALDLGDGIQVQINNGLTIVTHVVIDEAGFGDGAPNSRRFEPSSTTITYRPSITTGEIQILNGQLAGIVDYFGTAEVTLGPTFTFDLSGSEAPISTLALPSPGVANPTLALDLAATLMPNLSPFNLPPFNYTQTFRFDVTNGTTSHSDARLFIDTFEIKPNENNAGATAVVAVVNYVLKDAGFDVFGKLAEVVPEEVVDVLKGRVNILPGVTLANLIDYGQEVAPGNPVDTPLDFLQFFGVPEAAITIAEAIVDAVDFAQQLQNDPIGAANSMNEDQEPGNGQDDRADRLDYLGRDPTAVYADVMKLFRGETVRLVEWGVDVTQDKYVQRAVQLVNNPTNLRIEPRPNGAGGMTNYVVGHFEISEEKIIDNLVRLLPGGESGAAERILRWVVAKADPGIDFAFSGDLALAAAAHIGVDSGFLQPRAPGVSIEDHVANSLYVSSGNLVDFAFNVKAEISASVKDVAGGVFGPIIEAGEGAWDNIYHSDEGQIIGGTVGSVGESTGLFLRNPTFNLPSVSDLLNAAGSARASLEIGGSFLFGLCDPNNDGKLTLREILDVPNFTEIFAVKTDLSLEADGHATLAGMNFNFSIPRIDLFPLDAACDPEPNGPSLAELDNRPTNATHRMKVFAEVVAVASPNGPINVLQVYGSGSADLITVAGTLLGRIVVTRNGSRLVFDPSSEFYPFATVVVGLRNDAALQALGYAPAGSNGYGAEVMVPVDGGNDTVNIFSSVPASMPVIVHAGSGDDVVRANNEQGFDPSMYFQGSVAFFGGDGDDKLVGSAGNDVGNISILAGEGGHDFLVTGIGLNILDGGSGDDVLWGLDEGSGFSANFGSTGIFIGGSGDDVLNVGDVSRGNYTLIGGSLTNSDDPGLNVLLGGFGNDVLIAGNATQIPNTLTFIPDMTSTQMSFVCGGPGDDYLYGQSGQDFLIGGYFNTTSNAGRDIIFGGEGNDYLLGGNGSLDAVKNLFVVQSTGGSGELHGQSGQDFLLGGRGNDNIFGDAGDDDIDCGLGTNSATGGTDDDSFVTGRGVDELKGESGMDTFVITTPAGTVITDSGTIHIDAGSEDDIAYVYDTLAALPVEIIGGVGNDTFFIATTLAADNGNLNAIAGLVTISGGEPGISGKPHCPPNDELPIDRDVLYVNDRGQAGRMNYIVTPTSITSALEDGSARTFAGVNFDGTVDFVRLDGTDDVNVFDVSPSVTTQIYIDGNLPLPGECIPGGGDYLKLNTTGTTGRRLFIEQRGEGHWQFTSPHQHVCFTSIERFNHVEILAVGAGITPEGWCVVRAFDVETDELRVRIFPYEASFMGGVRVATGDVNHDGIPDLITAPGEGFRPVVRVFDGTPDRNGEYGFQEITHFLAYSDSFLGGVNIAVGDVNGDGCNEIVTGAGLGWRPQVRIFDSERIETDHGMIGAPFDAFHRSFRGGVNVAVGDLNNDGYSEVVVGAQRMRSQVAVFDGAQLSTRTAGARHAAKVHSFSAFDPFLNERRFEYKPPNDYDRTFHKGVFVAIGDVNGDGIRDLIASSGSGFAPRAKFYSGDDVMGSARLTRGDQLSNLQPPDSYEDFVRTGLRLAVKPIDGGNPGNVEKVSLFMCPGVPSGTRTVHEYTLDATGNVTVTDHLFEGGEFEKKFYLG